MVHISELGSKIWTLTSLLWYKKSNEPLWTLFDAVVDENTYFVFLNIGTKE